MAKNIIALMFPEYNDVGNPVTSKDWTTDEFYNDRTLGIHIKETDNFVDYFMDEECCLVYDSKNVQAFLYIAYTLPNCYPSRAAQLRSIFKHYGLKDWRRNRVSSEKKNYIIHYKTIIDDIRTEIASRQENSPADSFLIATNVFGKNGKTWELKTENSSFSVESLPMFIPTVFDWLSKHHKPPRVYEWNEKHGENGKGAHPDNKGEEVSVLDSSREHAGKLLPKAIGLPNYDTLYCYDDMFNKYMEYKAGCKFERLPENAVERKYHSFHINDDNRVPKRVAYKIKTLQKLSE